MEEVVKEEHGGAASQHRGHGGSRNTTATELNFHLPYLTLFARWCVLLSNACVADRKANIKGSATKQDQKAIPVTVSTAYFNCYHIGMTPQPPTEPRPLSHPIVFMGASLGLSSAKSIWAWPARLRSLRKLFTTSQKPQ